MYVHDLYCNFFPPILWYCYFYLSSLQGLSTSSTFGLNKVVKIESSQPTVTVNKRALKTITAAERRVNHASLINLVCLTDPKCVHVHTYARACAFSLFVARVCCLLCAYMCVYVCVRNSLWQWCS